MPFIIDYMGNHYYSYISGVDDNGNPIYSRAHVSGSDNAAKARIQSATNQSNFALAQYQNQWNLQQWQRENEYNSPAAMRQRLAEAGMNPAFYGLDGVAQASQLTSADMANQESPQMTPRSETFANLMSGLSGGVQAALEPFQLALAKKSTESQIERNEYMNRKDNADVYRIQSECKVNAAKAASLLKDIEVADANIDLIKQQKLESIARVGETKAKENLTKTMDELYQKQRDYYVKEVVSKLDLNAKQAALYVEQRNKFIKDCVLTDKKITLQEIENSIRELEKRYTEEGLKVNIQKVKAEVISDYAGMFGQAASFIQQAKGGSLNDTYLQINSKEPDTTPRLDHSSAPGAINGGTASW